MFHMAAPEYDHTYATCQETYSTLRIFCEGVTASDITNFLGVVPTKSFEKGESHSHTLRRRTNGWFLSTQDLSDSKDTRYHIDLILGFLEGKAGAIDELRARGCEIDITSYWVSSGQGGPELRPDQMVKLGAMGITVWWDVYFRRSSET